MGLAFAYSLFGLTTLVRVLFWSIELVLSTTVVFVLSHDLVRVWLLPVQEVLMRCNPNHVHRLETHVAYEAEEVMFLGLGSCDPGSSRPLVRFLTYGFCEIRPFSRSGNEAGKMRN
jgi:hypothetical protein